MSAVVAATVSVLVAAVRGEPTVAVSALPEEDLIATLNAAKDVRRWYPGFSEMYVRTAQVQKEEVNTCFKEMKEESVWASDTIGRYTNHL